MNAGIIASRYAKAFLKYAQEEGSGNEVYSQVCKLVRIMNELPQMRGYLEASSDISMERKISLMSAALEDPVSPVLVRFFKMVKEHRREEYFSRMLLSFIEQYRQANGIKVGYVVTAGRGDALADRLENIFHDITGAEVRLEERISPDLIGGFVFELDGYRLDASVRSHLDRIRRQLVEKNNRIV